jgi:hypothetical protein
MGAPYRSRIRFASIATESSTEPPFKNARNKGGKDPIIYALERSGKHLRPFGTPLTGPRLTHVGSGQRDLLRVSSLRPGCARFFARNRVHDPDPT